MTISVLIPTYRRPADLRRCLAALARQERRADQVIVVAREDDDESRACFESMAPIAAEQTLVRVREPGVVAAMNAGVAHATGDVVALTDDDAAPWPDWLARIERYFAGDERLGGVGGRDWIYRDGQLDNGRATRCGELRWWGRLTSGHHHAAPGIPREVHVLKGVNCAYRTPLLNRFGFDARLAGAGAQVHWELSLGLALRRDGWTLLFDPGLGVDHYPAARFDEDQRGRFNGVAQRNATANETMVLAEHLPAVQRAVYLAWAGLIGTSAAPGLLQVPRLMLSGQRRVLPRWWATLRGRVAGLRMYRRSRRAAGAASTTTELLNSHPLVVNGGTR